MDNYSASRRADLRISRRLVLGGLAAAVLARPLGAAGGARFTLALQEGGTASWEIAAMRAAGMDAAQGLTLEVRQVADSKAAQVALQAGAVDAMLSDFVWVSGQRRRGADFTFVPHSLAVGGLMAPPGGPLQSLAALEGKTLAVAGGPLDKSYAILQAAFAAQTGKALAPLIEVRFGAPPLVQELLLGGQVDAALNFWHFNARAGLAGMREVISVKAMLAGLGLARTPPLLGWVFAQSLAEARPGDVARFLDASFATKDLLASDDAIWRAIRPQMRGAEADDALFAALRGAYRAGIVRDFGAQDLLAARQTHALLARYGATEDGADLAPGTFWAGYSR